MMGPARGTQTSVERQGLCVRSDHFIEGKPFRWAAQKFRILQQEGHWESQSSGPFTKPGNGGPFTSTCRECRSERHTRSHRYSTLEE